MAHITKILVTIDVECSIGGHFQNPNNLPVGPEKRIFCKIGGMDYGIGMIMDILERHGLRGVFFVETEARHYFGDLEIARVVESIVKRGHEVQLHIHPEFLFFTEKYSRKIISSLAACSAEEQKEIVRKGKAFLEKSGARQIRAFRAGSFLLNADTLSVMHENGISYSSSYNLSVKDRYGALRDECEYNAPFYISGLTEIPVTCLKQNRMCGNAYRPLQLCSVSIDELKKAITFYINNNVSVITIITHSFELTRHSDYQYSKLSPYKLTIGRFNALCQFLSALKEKASIITFSDIGADRKEEIIVMGTNNVIYNSPFIDTSMRDIQQLIFR